MSFTATHYNEVARIIRNAKARAADRACLSKSWKQACDLQTTAVQHVQEDLSRMFAADNPQFDAERFALNCEPKAGGAK